MNSLIESPLWKRMAQTQQRDRKKAVIPCRLGSFVQHCHIITDFDPILALRMCSASSTYLTAALSVANLWQPNKGDGPLCTREFLTGPCQIIGRLNFRAGACSNRWQEGVGDPPQRSWQARGVRAGRRSKMRGRTSSARPTRARCRPPLRRRQPPRRERLPSGTARSRPSDT